MLKFVVKFPELRKAVVDSGMHKLIVKICVDAARMTGKENVTALSIMLLIPGLGSSSRYVLVESAYFGDDHKCDLESHLELGSLSELAVLMETGLELPGVAMPIAITPLFVL